MAEFHPFFVHFPIALICAAVLFDLYAQLKSRPALRQVALALQLLGALGAVFAAVSGNSAQAAIQAHPEVAQAISQTLARHVSWGNGMIWLILAFAGFRVFALLEKKPFATQGWLFPLLSMLLSALILATGFMGGHVSQSLLRYHILH